MRNATLLLIAAVLALVAPRAEAQCTGTEGVDFQRITLDELNAIPQANIDALNAAGADLTTDDIVANITSPLNGERVEFSAVILTDPLKSGLGSPSGTGAPNRYHVFVRDTAADTEGPAGMGAQLVDGNGISVGAITDFFVGDEVTVCGEVAYFSITSQVDPESITSNSNPRSADDPILDPVVVTTDEIHDVFAVNGEDLSQIDWDVYADYVNQYVRFEAVELVQGVNATNGRPNMLFSTSGDDTAIRSADTSVCFRNDRQASSYYPGGDVPACVTDGEFVPPATGIINLQGFLALPGTFDAFNSTVPPGGAFAVIPFEASDFEIAVAPPIVTVEDTGLATPDGAVVRATVVPGTAGNTIASVTVAYETSSGATGTVELANTSGDIYEGTITGLAAGDFVTYTITAADNQGAATPVGNAVTRLVVDGAISSIYQVQATADGGPGGSGVTTADPVAFDLDATVQSVFFDGAVVTIQDDPSLGAFSGVWVDFEEATTLAVGDQITITEARVAEDFDVTTLFDVTYEVTGSGDALGYKEVTTDLFNGADGADTAEQHEGMLLTFADVTIVATNADDPSGPFGEFLISSDGTVDNALRVDDFSAEISYEGQDPGTIYAEGNMLSYIRGPLYYSFGNYKLTPATAGDIGELTVAVEGDLETSNVRIVGSYPNPATGAARVRFELATASDVSLRVFDAMGRQVAVVAEGAFSAGAQDVAADLGGLASGLYVLRLQAGGEVATTRIAVVR